MNGLNHGRFQQQIRFLRQQFLQDADLPFARVLTSASNAENCSVDGAQLAGAHLLSRRYSLGFSFASIAC